MNKLTRSLLPIGFCLSSSLGLPGAMAATRGIDSLQDYTIKSFLQKANNPQSSLHKQLLEINLADGRNPNGIFPKVLKVKDIRIVAIDGSDQFGSYCYGIEGKPEHFRCSMGVYETYLIMIDSKMGVHKATEYQRFLFVVKSSKNIEWKINEKEKRYDQKESIAIGEPVQVPLEKIVPN
jgi:hypothetical protein